MVDEERGSSNDNSSDVGSAVDSVRSERAHRMIHYSLYSVIMSTVLAVIIVVVYSQISKTPSPLRKIDRVIDHNISIKSELQEIRGIVNEVSLKIDSVVSHQGREAPTFYDCSKGSCSLSYKQLLERYSNVITAFYVGGLIPRGDSGIAQDVIDFNSHANLLPHDLVNDLSPEDDLLMTSLAYNLHYFINSSGNIRSSLLPASVDRVMDGRFSVTKSHDADSAGSEVFIEISQLLDGGIRTSDLPRIVSLLGKLDCKDQCLLVRKQAAKIYVMDSFIGDTYNGYLGGTVCLAQ